MKNKKVIRRFCLWLLLPALALYVSVLLVASWYINRHEEQIRTLVLHEASKATKGTVTIGQLEASAWKSFPYLRVGIRDIALKDSVYHRPVLRIDDAHAGVSLLGFIFRKASLSSLTVDGGALDLLTDSSGYSNQYVLDFKKENNPIGAKKAALSFSVFDKTVYLENFHVVLADYLHHKRFGVFVNKIKTRIHQSRQTMQIALKQDLRIEGLGFKLSNGSFLKNMPMVTEWKHMRFDPGKKVLSFDPSPVYFRDTLYRIGGWFNFSSDSATSHMHLEVAAPKTTFAHASSILSENIQRKLHTFGWDGLIDVTATLDGSLHQSTPSIQVKAIARNSTLILPDKTAEVDSCNFTGYYNNRQLYPKGEPDDTNSVIHLDHFIGKLNGGPLKGNKIQVKDLIHPVLSVQLVSDADLSNLDKSLDFQTVQFTGGRAVLALNYEGPVVNNLHAIENMSGSLVMKNAEGRYIPKNYPFHDCNGKVVFDPNHLNVEDLRFFINQNHFLINVKGIRAAEDTALFGIPEVNCEVKASAINLNNFLAVFDQKDSTPALQRRSNLKTSISKETLPIDDLLKRGKLRLQLTADSVIYNNFYGQRLQASLAFHDNQWSVDSLYLAHANGNLALRAQVTQFAHYNAVDFAVQLRNMDISKTFYAFDNFGIDAIGYQNLRGRISAIGNFHTKIDPTGSIVRRSTRGHLDFDFNNGQLLNFRPLMKIQQYVFRRRNLYDVSFAPVHSAFDLENGILYIHPLIIRSSLLDLSAEGIYSPYGETDIQVRVPFRSLHTDLTGNNGLANDKVNVPRESSLLLQVSGKKGSDATFSVRPFAFQKHSRTEYYAALFEQLKRKRYR